MEKNNEIKDIMWMLNLTSCNLIQYVSESDELIKNILEKLEKYSDLKERYFPILINLEDFQRTSIELENKLIKFYKDKNIDINDEYYDLLNLRKIAFETEDLDTLRSYKSKIFKLEKEISSEQLRSMKRIILYEYFNSKIPLELFEQYPELKKYDSENIINKLMKKKESIESKTDEILTTIDLENPFFEIDILYRYLRNMSSDYKKNIVVLAISGERIVDYDLQEVINYSMCNQRSGVFTFNFITADTIYHRYFQECYLEETDDIITTNVKSKRYLKDLNY